MCHLPKTRAPINLNKKQCKDNNRIKHCLGSTFMTLFHLFRWQKRGCSITVLFLWSTYPCQIKLACFQVKWWALFKVICIPCNIMTGYNELSCIISEVRRGGSNPAQIILLDSASEFTFCSHSEGLFPEAGCRRYSRLSHSEYANTQGLYTLRKKGSKRVIWPSPKDNPSWFQLELFHFPCRNLCGKGSTWTWKGSTWNKKKVINR
jgi:hypothetical protein